MISACTCKHEDQDDLHGKGNRVFNACRPKNWPGERWHRCTVCNVEKIIPEGGVKP